MRGAYNKVSSLPKEQQARGVISYSSGNHAQGVAYAARALGIKSIIVMPNNAPQIKREATAALGAEIILVGPGSTERQEKAETLAAQYGYAIVPPYNDEKIIAGQGTMGLEILEDLPGVECILAPVGGGGMISGIATAVKLSRPDVKVIGVEPEFASDAQASFRSGYIVNMQPSKFRARLPTGCGHRVSGQSTSITFANTSTTSLRSARKKFGERCSFWHLTLRRWLNPVARWRWRGFYFTATGCRKLQLTVAVVSGGNIDPKLLQEVRQ